MTYPKAIARLAEKFDAALPPNVKQFQSIAEHLSWDPCKGGLHGKDFAHLRNACERIADRYSVNTVTVVNYVIGAVESRRASEI